MRALATILRVPKPCNIDGRRRSSKRRFSRGVGAVISGPVQQTHLSSLRPPSAWPDCPEAASLLNAVGADFNREGALGIIFTWQTDRYIAYTSYMVVYRII